MIGDNRSFSPAFGWPLTENSFRPGANEALSQRFLGLKPLADPVLLLILKIYHPRYGKTLNGPVQSSIVSMISVPKSYFTHFYIFSSIYLPLLLLVALHQYTTSSPHPLVTSSLDLLCTSSRPSSSSPSSILLVLLLLSLQCFRRLYECLFVNQASKSTMNLTHYIVGFAHYFCAGTGVLCEAPGSTTSSPSLSSLSWTSLPLTLLFLWAWHQQLVAHQTFASLKVTCPTKHSVPRGGLFSLVSCPHYTMEILLYTVIMLLLGTSHSTGRQTIGTHQSFSQIDYKTTTACPKKSVPVMKGSTHPVHEACHAPSA